MSSSVSQTHAADASAGTDFKASKSAGSSVPIKVWVGGASAACGKSAINALLTYPNVTIVAGSRDTTALAKAYAASAEAKRISFVATSCAGGVLSVAGTEAKAAAGATPVLAGIDTLLLVIPHPVIGNRPEVGPAYAKGAKAAGVKHIIILCMVPDAAAKVDVNSEHDPFVAEFASTGIPLTKVRVGWFLEGLLQHAATSIKATTAAGADPSFSYPLNGDVKLPAISIADIGRVGALIASTPNAAAVHGGKDYLITNERVTLNQLANAISKATNKKVSYIQETPDAFVKRFLAAGLPPILVEGLLAKVYRAWNDTNLSELCSKLDTDAPKLLSTIERQPDTMAQLVAATAWS